MTKQGDEKAWSDFVAWCHKRGLNAMPANPWTVAAYARWCERQHRYPAIMRTIRAVARVHRAKSPKRPDRHPTVARTLRLIESRARARSHVKGKGLRLFPENDLIGGAGATGGDEATAGTQAGKSAKRPPTKADAKARPATRRGLRAAPKLVAKRKLSK
ncbi:MAG: hypothetical protein HYZ04_04470 [Rhodospirillales bacterium]|nr:hypothetical protein [Rhodospirillales bacterium]